MSVPIFQVIDPTHVQVVSVRASNYVIDNLWNLSLIDGEDVVRQFGADEWGWAISAAGNFFKRPGHAVKAVIA